MEPNGRSTATDEDGTRRLSGRAVTWWRVRGALGTLPLVLIALGLAWVQMVRQAPMAVAIAGMVITVGLTVAATVIVPTLRARRWRYRIGDDAVLLVRGIWIVRRTLVPLVRIQNVDTVEGPLLRALELSSVHIATAATTHEIPALEAHVALDLRDRIAAAGSRAELPADEDLPDESSGAVTVDSLPGTIPHGAIVPERAAIPSGMLPPQGTEVAVDASDRRVADVGSRGIIQPTAFDHRVADVGITQPTASDHRVANVGSTCVTQSSPGPLDALDDDPERRTERADAGVERDS